MSGKILIHKIALDHNLSEELAKQILMSLVHDIEALVQTTGRCQIRGFGTFKLKKFAPRLSHDYVTRTMITLPAKTKLVFEHTRERTHIFEATS